MTRCTSPFRELLEYPRKNPSRFSSLFTARTPSEWAGDAPPEAQVPRRGIPAAMQERQLPVVPRTRGVDNAESPCFAGSITDINSYKENDCAALSGR
jgi:hypothetical protein